MRRVLIPPHVPDIAPVAARPAPVVSLAGRTMGTTWSVKCVTSDAASGGAIRKVVEARLATVVSQMSQWQPDSDLSHFNRADAGCRRRLPEELFFVLKTALELARGTGGAYDPSIGALSELWGFGADGRRDTIPSPIAVARAHGLVGWRRLLLDEDRREALQPGGLLLDLSSIAKGFAVDFVSDALSRHGWTDHLVEIGGELRGSGRKPDGLPWWVALEETGAAGPQTVVALHHLSVATSGDAQRRIVADGRVFSHTLDPRSGWPIPDRTAAVTVLHRSCMMADALATALSVLGEEHGSAYAQDAGLAARFVLRGPAGLEERITSAFATMVAD